ATGATSGTSFSRTASPLGNCNYSGASNLTEVVVCESPQTPQPDLQQQNSNANRNQFIVLIGDKGSSLNSITMLDLDRHPLPDQLGYLILSEDGSVHASGGELENDERSANIISNLLTLTESVDPAIFNARSCRKVSIVFADHSFTICLSNKRIYVVKKRNRTDASANSGIESDNHSILA
uniref:Late endosomal/lysosomal adaptor and MAPK and MTOR activator 4 n=1 Tax=Anopheles culicifacies TaxID=139723 RepID=A0A182MVI3_9DIPT